MLTEQKNVGEKFKMGNIFCLFEYQINNLNCAVS